MPENMSIHNKRTKFLDILLERVEHSTISAKDVVRDLVNWFTPESLEQFMEANGYWEEEDEEEWEVYSLRISMKSNTTHPYRLEIFSINETKEELLFETGKDLKKYVSDFMKSEVVKHVYVDEASISSETEEMAGHIRSWVYPSIPYFQSSDYNLKVNRLGLKVIPDDAYVLVVYTSEGVEYLFDGPSDIIRRAAELDKRIDDVYVEPSEHDYDGYVVADQRIANAINDAYGVRHSEEEGLFVLVQQDTVEDPRNLHKYRLTVGKDGRHYSWNNADDLIKEAIYHDTLAVVHLYSTDTEAAQRIVDIINHAYDVRHKED
jgi:hypothetical protein